MRRRIDFHVYDSFYIEDVRPACVLCGELAAGNYYDVTVGNFAALCVPCLKNIVPKSMGCPACGYDRRVHCPRCYGDGEYIYDADNDDFAKVCDKCDGEGAVECPMCK